MWAPLAGQAAAQLDAPSAASSLAAAALWEHAPAWAGAALGPQHQAQLSPGAQRALEQGQGLAWPNPGQPEPHQHQSAQAAKIYIQGLPHNLQHPVAVAGLFTPFGDVLDVKLYAAEVRLSGGSAVVRMRNMSQAASAIAALNGVVPDGGWQQLTVRAAETAEQRSNRITAINGRQSGGSIGGLGLLPTLSPTSAAALPPTGPAAASAALRRVHSARGAGSQGSLHCYTGALVAEGGGGVPGGTPRQSVEWGGALAGRDASMDSRRSSMDALRPASAAFARSSSDSGSGGEASEEGADAGGPPAAEAQRMLLEAVLALLAQVEAGQLSLGAMRGALEAALTAAKAGLGDAPPNASDSSALVQGRASNGHSPTAVARA